MLSTSTIKLTWHEGILGLTYQFISDPHLYSMSDALTGICGANPKHCSKICEI